MKVLVTGAGGFLGQYVVKQLTARGDRVRALCRTDGDALKAQGVDVARGDLRDRAAVVEACRGIDAVFHIGGMSGIGGCWRDYYQSNVLGTRHIVEGCLAHGVGRLVYTSSPSVTFDGRNQEGVDESTPYGGPIASEAGSPASGKRWLCHYARSKALAERHVLTANGTGGLHCCALRPHLIWGPGDRHLIPGLLANAEAGRLWRVGSGANMIDTVYVENAASAHLLAAAALNPGSPAAGQAYFISQGEPVNCWAWIDEILSLVGLPSVRRSMSPRMAWLVGAAYEWTYRLLRRREEPPMTRFLAAQLSHSHYFNIERARRDLGYHPAISMAEGMQRLAASLRQCGTV
ncbi:MAG: NAD-dependent epimerase/dehydratase family protein [Thermoguttaceae bacterium]